jgi:hypothetical protein
LPVGSFAAVITGAVTATNAVVARVEPMAHALDREVSLSNFSFATFCSLLYRLVSDLQMLGFLLSTVLAFLWLPTA